MTHDKAVIISSTRNRRIVEARKLDQRKHRQRQGRFLVEGLQLLHTALEAGTQPLEVFYCPEQFAGPQAPALLERLRASGAELMEVSPRIAEALSKREVPQGLAVTFALFDTSLSSVELSGQPIVVVLDRLQDPGNLGTLIRTADAVGAAAAILIEPCVDPFDPKTARATMGSLFNVPLVRTSDPDALFGQLHDRGLRSLGADAHLGKLWGHGLWRNGVALVLGNEARGLSHDVRRHIQDWVHLPMVGKAESLNVAVAGGILMYTWLQHNMEQNP